MADMIVLNCCHKCGFFHQSPWRKGLCRKAKPHPCESADGPQIRPEPALLDFSPLSSCTESEDKVFNPPEPALLDFSPLSSCTESEDKVEEAPHTKPAPEKQDNGEVTWRRKTLRMRNGRGCTRTHKRKILTGPRMGYGDPRTTAITDAKKKQLHIET